MEGLQTRTGQIQAAADLESSLTCSIVRFLKRSLGDQENDMIPPRMQHCFPSIYSVLMVACLLASTSAAVAKEVGRERRSRLCLHLTPQKIERGKSDGLGVSYTLLERPQGGRSLLVLRLDTLEPALERSTDQVTELHAYDAHGLLHLAGPMRVRVGDREFQTWTSSRPVHGLLHVAYIVPVASPSPPRRGPHIDLQAAGGGVSGALVSVLLLPQLTGHVRTTLVWHTANGERAVTTFAYGNSSVTTTVPELENTLFLAGPLQTYPSKPPTKGFSMYALGLAPGALQSAAGWYQRAYEVMRQALHPRNTKAFRVFIRSYDGGPLDSGRANEGSLLLYLPPSVNPGSAAEHFLISHEMVHVFTKPLSETSTGKGDWYTEGIADYLAMTVPFAAGLYSPTEYLRLVNSEAALYYTNPDRELSLPDAAEAKWKGNITWTVPYARGSMYFANLDAELSTRRYSVLELIRQMNREIESGRPGDDKTWVRLLGKQLGGQAVHEWGQMCDGHLLQPVREAFGKGLVSRQISTGFFSLGYSPAYHTKGTVIEQVEAGTNAERAGLLAGDKLLETIDINPLSHSFDTPMQLQVGRQGKSLAISFDPHTRERVLAWNWNLEQDK